MTTVPSGTGAPGVAVQLPLLSTTAVRGAPLASRSTVPPTVSVMVSPGLPVPGRTTPLVGSMTGTEVSTASVSGPLVLPARSVWVALSEVPLGTAAARGTLQLPLASTTAVPSTVAPFMRVTVAPGSPVPETAPTPLVGAMTGAATVVSTVMGSAVGALVLPAGSVAVTLRALRPSASVDVLVLQLPLASTTAVPTVVPAAFWMVMVSPGVPVPLSVGVVSLVLLSPRLPVSLLLSKAAAGAAGAVVSMVTLRVPGALVLPCRSVAVTLRLVVPSGKAVVGVMAQLPLPSTTAVPSTVVPLGAYSVMVSPAVPVPDMVGVVSLVMLSVSKLPVSLVAATSGVGALGAVASMVTGTVVGALVLPAGSVAVTFRL